MSLLSSPFPKTTPSDARLLYNHPTIPPDEGSSHSSIQEKEYTAQKRQCTISWLSPSFRADLLVLVWAAVLCRLLQLTATAAEKSQFAPDFGSGIGEGRRAACFYQRAISVRFIIG